MEALHMQEASTDPRERTFKEVLAELQAICGTQQSTANLRLTLKTAVTWLGIHAADLSPQQLLQVSFGLFGLHELCCCKECAILLANTSLLQGCFAVLTSCLAQVSLQAALPAIPVGPFGSFNKFSSED